MRSDINKCFSVISVCVLLCGVSQFALASDRCESNYKLGLYDKALTECRSLAINGIAKGKYILGLMYLDGAGVEADNQMATNLIREAAQLGDADALHKMGEFYQEGNVGNQDSTKACDWWAQLADAGDAQGQEKLGVCFILGRGRVKDMKMGYAYLSLAAKNGNKAATYIMDTYGDRFPDSAKKEALKLAKHIENK